MRRSRNLKKWVIFISKVLLISLLLFTAYLTFWKNSQLRTELNKRENLLEVMEQNRKMINELKLQPWPKPSTLSSSQDATPVPGYLNALTSKEDLQLRCQTCALVSNSGMLLDSKAGGDIDSSDCVIRMNNAPTAGYEADVGSRTDVRVIGHTNIIKQKLINLTIPEEEQTWLFVDESTKTKHVIVHWGHLEFMDQELDAMAEFRLLRFWAEWYPKVQFHVLNSNRTNRSSELAFRLITQNHNSTGFVRKYFAPSTGWFTIQFALDVCQNINIYGVNPISDCRLPGSNITYHYYKGRSNTTEVNQCEYYSIREIWPRKAHRLLTEKYMFAKLAKEVGNVQFFLPTWDLDKDPNSNITATAKFIGFANNGTFGNLTKVPGIIRRKIIYVKRIIKRRNYTEIQTIKKIVKDIY